MIARLQQVITAALAAFGLGWACYFASTGRAAWAPAGALLIAGGYVLCIGVEFVLLALVRRPDDPIPHASARSLLRAWLGELSTAPRVFCWRQPFRSARESDSLPPGSAARRGVVFVHGFFCNRALWNPWMARLRARGVPFMAVSLEPAFGAIDAYQGMLEAAVRRLELATGVPPVIVAHSMGGLAVRAWLASQPDPQRVHRIVTIGSPHAGTWLARLSQARNGKQMRLRSRWLVELAQREASRPQPYARFTCFFSNCDNIVFPTAVAALPGADNRLLTAVAHVQMVYAQPIADEVDRWLAAPAEASAAAPQNTTSPGTSTPASISPCSATRR